MKSLASLLEGHASDLALTDGQVEAENFEFCDDREIVEYLVAIEEIDRNEVITEALVDSANDKKLFSAVLKVLGNISHNEVTTLLEELADALKEAATRSIRTRLVPFYDEAVAERARDGIDRRNWLGLSRLQA